MSTLTLIGAIVTLAGSVFLFLAGLGMLRMPDVYNRMQAGTKATTLGSIMFFLGLGIAQPHWLPKMLLLAVFIIFTNPISSHVLARASHKSRIALYKSSVRDDLAGVAEEAPAEETV